MREAALQDRIEMALDEYAHDFMIAWRNNCGFDSMNRVRYGVGNPGGADFIACVSGRFVGVEIKTPVGRQTPEQKQFEHVVKSKGGIYVVLRSVEEARQWAENMRSSK